MSDVPEQKPEEKAPELPFDEKIFWKWYEDFRASNYRNEEINGILSEQLRRAYADIHLLKRPEKGYEYICGWIALSSKGYMNKVGSHVVMPVSIGDVMIEQHQWDRDVMVTQAPLCENMVSGNVLRSYHGEANGLWLPVYDPKILRIAIDMRTREIREEALAFLEKERKFWPPFAEKMIEKKKR